MYLHDKEMYLKLKRRVHLNIGEVMYFDSKNDEWTNVYWEVFGHGYFIKNNHENISIENLLPIHEDIFFEILDSEDDLIKVKYDNTILRITKAQKDKLINYISKINKKTKEQRRPFEQKIHAITQTLEKDMTIRKYFHAYLENTPSYYFYDINIVIQLEAYLYEQSPLGSTFLNTSTPKRMTVLNHQTPLEEAMYHRHIIKFNKYFQNHFIRFVNLIKSKYTFENNTEALYTIYNLITSAEKDYFSKKIIKTYGDALKDTSRYTLKETLESYYEISISPFDSETLYSLVHYLQSLKILEKNTFLNLYKITDIIKEIHEEYKSIEYENQLIASITPNIATIEDTDLLSGIEFEELINRIFMKLGYESYKTKATGDQGIDVIGLKNGKKIGIQAKCFTGKVSNSAIQEVVAGIKYYGCNRGMVITNSYFTNSAQILAKANNVILWDRQKLAQKLQDLQIEI